MAVAPPDEAAYDDYDLENARLAARFRDAGLEEEAMFDVTRVLGRGMSQGAEAIRLLIERSFQGEGVSERELARRNAEAAEQLLPEVGPLLQALLTVHLRDQVRQQAVRVAELGDEASRGKPIAVAFADLVGYTRLGQHLDANELGAIAHRLEIVTTEVAESPVRLVKTIGDAVMLVAPESAPLLDATLKLLDRADGEGDDFPELHIGVAAGLALNRSGDWYGQPVNLASRITAIARPGSVLASEEVRDQAGERFAWSFAGERSLRGVRREQKLFRARRLEAPSGDSR